MDYDSSSLGFGSDITEQQSNLTAFGNEIKSDDLEKVENFVGVIVIKKSMESFRKQFMDHFDICFQMNKISWSTRVEANAPKNYHS